MVNAAYAGGVVNARMVNAGPSYIPPPHFCESFPAFAPIPRFRNPFKYTGRLRINLPGDPKGEDPAIFLLDTSMAYGDAAALSASLKRIC